MYLKKGCEKYISLKLVNESLYFSVPLFATSAPSEKVIISCSDDIEYNVPSVVANVK